MSKKSPTKLAFIIGHYKSGSTWLSHALALHPDVRSMHEMHIFRYLKESSDFNEAVHRLFNTSSWGNKGTSSFLRNYMARSTRVFRKLLHLSKGTATLPTEQIPNRAQDLGLYNYFRLKMILRNSSSKEDFLNKLFTFLSRRVKHGEYIIEKTPTNIFEVDAIKNYFPNAKLISIHRDGRDVAVSDRYHIRRVHGTERSIKESAEHWKQAMDAEMNACKDNSIFQASYEEMQNDPDTLLKNLLIYLELDHSPEIIREMIYKSSFKFATGGRNKGSADANNFRRKGIVGDWKNELTDQEINIINEVAGELLTEFNYK